MSFRSPLFGASFVLFSVACDKTPEPIRREPPKETGSGGSVTTQATAEKPSGYGNGEPKGAATNSGALMPRRPAPPISPDDPLKGAWTMEEAGKLVPGKGPLVATLDTSKGTLQCKLFDDKAPLTVANFIGLATGKRTWRDPRTKKWVNTPAYDNTTFHRVIQGFMIQGGDAAGSGMGEPGYVINDELWEGAKHDRAGYLCMANRGPNTNGAQFFITDASAPHLDGGYTIFGECAPTEVVHQIANVEKGERDKPTSPVTIKKVSISRGEKKK